MTTLYRINVQICGTVYVKADDEVQAMAKLEAIKMDHLEVTEDTPGDGDAFFVTGIAYDDPRLPELSMSPAMTIYGIWPGDTLELAEG